jgi:glycolate oxidase iron-sulfur subunit
MQAHLSPEFKDTTEGEAAAALLRKCVHCGFCNATCPTYQVTGDELDGPRGRIYLIKQVLEGAGVTRSTQQHLDRCLTCLNCQTTCPSGVEFGRLVDIGREIVEARVERPPAEKAVRWLLKEGMTSSLFAPAMRLGRALRPLLPEVLKDKVPRRGIDRVAPEPTQRQRKVLLLKGCVQPSMMPNIDLAAARVLDKAEIQVVNAGGGCCGALRTHLSDSKGALNDMRRNIDAWDPQLVSGDIEAVISSATACALAIKGYGQALANDPKYAERAAQVSRLALDLSELLPQLVPALKSQLRAALPKRVVFHAPCTLQHGQGLRGGVETHLRELGFDVAVAGEEGHMCCGSAGTYSILQPQLSEQLRERKLRNLMKVDPHYIVSANLGCIQHLQAGTSTRVMHWIELLDEAME